jgi:hypothetical protein
MKNKVQVIATTAFFVIVNTTYYWEGKLGLLAFPTFIFLFITYFVLVIALIRQIYLTIKEKLYNKIRLITVGILSLMLILTFFKPYGLIDFEKYEGENLLVAGSEGAANCTTTLKLKDDFTFKERTVCFGITEIKGKFYLQNDTIYFNNVELGKNVNEFYKFAVITPSKFNTDGNHYDLIRYNNITDTVGNKLLITKNVLSKLKR